MTLAKWFNLLSESGCCSCLGEKHECCDIRRVSCEAVRLAAERSYLLQRLQAMNRSLERRAESIRGFFESELRRGETRLQKANLQVWHLYASLSCHSCRSANQRLFPWRKGCGYKTLDIALRKRILRTD